MAKYEIRSNIGAQRREFMSWTEEQIAKAKAEINSIGHLYAESVARRVHIESGALKESIRGFVNDSGDEIEVRVTVGDEKAYWHSWERSRDGHDFMQGMTTAEDAIDAVMDGRPTPSLYFDNGEATH